MSGSVTFSSGISSEDRLILLLRFFSPGVNIRKYKSSSGIKFTSFGEIDDRKTLVGYDYINRTSQNIGDISVKCSEESSVVNIRIWSKVTLDGGDFLKFSLDKDGNYFNIMLFNGEYKIKSEVNDGYLDSILLSVLNDHFYCKYVMTLQV